MENLVFFHLLVLLSMFAGYWEFKHIYKVNGIPYVPFMEKSGADFYEKIEYGLFVLDLPTWHFFLYAIALFLTIAFYIVQVKFSVIFLVFGLVVFSKIALELYFMVVKFPKEAYKRGMSLKHFLQRLSVSPIAIGDDVVYNSEGQPFVTKIVEPHAKNYAKYAEAVIEYYRDFGLSPLSETRFIEMLPFTDEFTFFAKNEKNEEVMVKKRTHGFGIQTFLEGQNSVYKSLDMPIFFFPEWKNAKQIGTIMERVFECGVLGVIGAVIAYL